MLLVVFDLSGTLVAHGDHGIFPRPFSHELMQFLCDAHDADKLRFATWTSRQTAMALKMTRAVFSPEAYKRLLFTYDRSKCLIHPTIRHKSAKDLRVIWSNYETFNITNTIIVDDTIDKILYSQRRALYIIPTWEETSKNDQCLLELLNHIKYRIDTE